MSQDRAISMPPPAAEPLQAAITGLEHRRAVRPPKRARSRSALSAFAELGEILARAEHLAGAGDDDRAHRGIGLGVVHDVLHGLGGDAVEAFATSGRLMRMISRPSSRSSDTTVSVP